MNTSIENCANTEPRTSKIKRFFFPFTHCEYPEPEENNHSDYKGFFRTETTCYIDWKDRIKILFTGKILVTVKTVTEHEVGKSISTASFNVIL